MASFRVGQGFDVHAFAKGRPLVLGGVTIPYERGLLGHSDADVLLHAITDAILGAAGLGDIGRHFPDTDQNYKNADSRVLLRKVVTAVQESDWQIVNIDATIIAQAPKIMPYAPAMVAHISEDLNIPIDSINIKGKTTEYLGFLGRKEGIAAEAVVLLAKQV